MEESNLHGSALRSLLSNNSIDDAVMDASLQRCHDLLTTCPDFRELHKGSLFLDSSFYLALQEQGPTCAVLRRTEGIRWGEIDKILIPIATCGSNEWVAGIVRIQIGRAHV